MVDSSSGANLQKNPKKWLAVAGLAITLGVVLVYQYDATPSSDSPSEGAAPHLPKKAYVAGANSLPKKAWPAIALSEALEHDPFATLKTGAMVPNADQSADGSPLVAKSEASDQSEAGSDAEKDAVSEKLSGQTVSIIFRNQRGAVAVLGSEVVHEGDMYEGLRVESIGPDGIVFENGPEK